MRTRALAATLCLVLSACGGAAAPSSAPATSGAASAAATTSSQATKPAASASAKPAGSASPKPAASASAAAGPAPEKAHLELAIAAPAGTYTPVLIGRDGGYFQKHGLDVAINTVSASVATQGLISGKIDIYQGGTAAIAGHLAGSDIIYGAAMVDKSNLMLIGQKGITTVEGLKGKGVATTSPGAFGEIAMRKTAKEHGMQVGTDIKMLFHPTPAAALTTFLTQPNDAGGIIITPPENLDAVQRGYPVIVDYFKEGVRIVGPGMSLTRDFYTKNPNTVKAFLEGYLDSLKRALDDPAYEKQLDSKYNQTTDPKLLDGDYQQGLLGWNKDLTVNPVAIQVVLDATDDPKAKTSKPADFYDNTLIQQVNRDYGSKLFPNDIKAS